MFSYTALFQIFAAGICFMLSNLAMKQLDGMPWYILYGAVAVFIMAGAWFEVQALREIQLGHAVATILSAEILLSIAVAAYFLHEQYTMRDVSGIALIIAGIVVLGLSKAPGEIGPIKVVDPAKSNVSDSVTPDRAPPIARGNIDI